MGNFHLLYVSWADMCQDPKKIRDPGSQDPGSEILEDLGSYILFSLGILEILDFVTVTAILPWDARDLGSRTEKILLDPEDPLSSLGKLSCRSWILHNNMSLYLEDPLHPNSAFGSPYLCAA